jgi:hypothetical protein
MASTTWVLAGQGKDLEAGKSTHHWWNHAQPAEAVFSLSVLPMISLQNNNLIDTQPATAEIRNVQYKYKRPIASVQSAELEIHYDVYNLSQYRIDWTVHIAIIK